MKSLRQTNHSGIQASIFPTPDDTSPLPQRALAGCLLLLVLLLLARGAGAQTVSTLVSEGFEGSFPQGWNVGNTNAAQSVSWGKVDSTFGGEGTHGGSFKGYCAAIGFLGTSNNPTYTTNMGVYMSRVVNLTPFTNASLSFWYKMPGVEACCDAARVMVDTTVVWSSAATQIGWTQVVIPLTAYLGGSHTLKFEFDSDHSVVAEGWYLDDILVAASPPPANDAFTNAVTLAGVSGSTSGTTVGASKEPGEPSHAGNNGGNSVWFRWIAPSSGTVTFNTFGSAFDTLLAAYRGTNVSALTTVTFDDDISPFTTSAITFDAVAGTEYRIALDGFGGAAGTYTLSWLYPVVTETVLSTAVTNVNNFIYDSDIAFGGAYNRDRLLVTTSVASTNQSAAQHFSTYALRYRLLDTNGLPQPILDSNGTTNAAFTYNFTNTINIAGHVSLTSATSAGLKPLVRLDPYNQYSVEVKIQRIGAFTGAAITNNPTTFLEFTNLVSGDVALNVIPFHFGDSFSQNWAVRSAPGQSALLVNASFGVFRYDDFSSALPSTDNTTVSFNYQLRRASDNALIPLKNSTTNFVHGVPSYTAGVPKTVGSLAVSDTLQVEPVGQIDCINDTYYLTVNFSCANGPSQPLVGGNPKATVATRVLYFNGNLFFGNIQTTIGQFGVGPSSTPPAGGLIAVGLPSVDGVVTAQTDHSYAGAGPLNANLNPAGDAFVTAGNAVLNAPVPDTDSLAKVRFTRGAMTLTPSGTKADITVLLPGGLGYRTNDINSKIIKPSILFTSVPMTTQLNPTTDLTYLPGVNIYAAEESKPVWLVTDRITWHLSSGKFDLPPVGVGAVCVRVLEYASLFSVSNNLVDPVNMGDKRSNDKYWLAVNGILSTATVRPDASSNALLTTAFSFTSANFRTHFPYDTFLGWSGGGKMTVVDDLPVPGAGSALFGNGPVSVSYTRDCPDCGGGGSANGTPTIVPTGGQLNFTADGGLVAAGSTTAAVNLQWGFIMPPINDFAQQAFNFSVGSFHMPGNFLRGDQNQLADVQGPATILYTGFGATNLNLIERPLTAGYSDGFADYAGINFRCDADSAHNARSTIAGTKNINWRLTGRSKYYVRYAGVSGIHEAVLGSFPTNLVLWGYKFGFSNYGVSYLASQMHDSRTDGQITLPNPAGFVQGFDNMKFTCLGAPESADVPQGDGFKVMAYWQADFKTDSIEFASTNTCSPAGGDLVLGIEAHASHVDKALYGRVGFFPNGDQIPASAQISDVTSRLKLPNLIKIEGPNKTTYTFTTVQDGYYNTFAGSPGVSVPGWINIFGKMDVPFFEDLKVHLQTSAHTNGAAASNSTINLSGGWPRPGSGHPDYGWDDTSMRNPFETNLFDWKNLGWPGSSGGLTIDKYRNNPDQPNYHPRAVRLWLGVVDFDYPLTWTPQHSFMSWKEQEVDLLIVHIKHNVKYMDAKRAEIDFGAQYDGLPNISIANLAFNAIDGATGVENALVQAVSKPVTDVLNTGLDELDQLMDTQMKRMMDGVFDRTINPLIDQFYNNLSNNWASGFANHTLSLAERQQFVASVTTNTDFFFAGQGASHAATTITTALKDLGDAGNAANNLVGQVAGYLKDATNAINSVIGGLKVGTDGQPLAGAMGLIEKVGGTRPIVPNLLQSLVGDIAPQFLNAVIGPTLDGVLKDIEPALGEITDTLTQTKNALSQVEGTLENAGEFTSEISNTLNTYRSELTNVSVQVSLNTQQYFNKLDYNVDNPFQSISVADVKAHIRQQLEDQFFATTAASQIQTSLRQRLYDVDAAMKQQVDSVFQQLNNVMRDLISQSLAQLDNSISQCLGDVKDAMGAGKLNGHADIDGDSLSLLRIDGHFQFKVPDNMELDAFLEIKELKSDGSSSCYSSNAPATEVTVGATKIPLDWAGCDAKANVEAKFTFDGSVPFPVNLGGQVELLGDLNFEAFQLHDLAAAMAFGKYENYIALKGGVRFDGYDFSGAIFFGRTCSLDPLVLIDPDVAKVLGNPPFTGAYVYAQGWLPVSELLLGIPPSCLFEISAGIGAGAFYFAEGPTYGGKMFLGVSGSLLCIVSIEGDVTLIGLKHGDDLRFDGHGHFEASLGPCPFCISVSKDIDLSYIMGSWHLN